MFDSLPAPAYGFLVVLVVALVILAAWLIFSVKRAEPQGPIHPSQPIQPRVLKLGDTVRYKQHPRSRGRSYVRAIVLYFYWGRKGQMALLLNQYDGRLSRPVSELV